MNSWLIAWLSGARLERPILKKRVRIVRATLLIVIVALGSFSCSQRIGDEMSGVTFVLSARARILEATSIARMRVVSREVLRVDENWPDTEVCGYRIHAEVVEVLEGEEPARDFRSNEPLGPGNEYVVALRASVGTTAAPDDPQLDERDRKFSNCLRQLPTSALGTASMVEIDGELRINVESSNLVPLELRDEAVRGTVKLSALVTYIKQIRKEHVGSRK